MHEISLCKSVLEIIKDEAAQKGFTRVLKIRLEIGKLSCAEPEAIRFSFQAVANGTLAEGAALEIRHPPGQAWCAVCCETVSIPQRYAPCPKCGGYEIQMTSGDQLRIVELDVA